MFGALAFVVLSHGLYQSALNGASFVPLALGVEPNG
jgi:hypothetical protein